MNTPFPYIYCVHFINDILKQIKKKRFTAQHKYTKQNKHGNNTLSKEIITCSKTMLETLEIGV